MKASNLVVLAIHAILVTNLASSAFGQSSPSPEDQRVRALEAKIASLQKQLSASNSRCQKLEDELSALKNGLNQPSVTPKVLPPGTPADGGDPAVTPQETSASASASGVISLPVKFTNKVGALPTVLLPGITATKLELKPLDASLAVKVIDPTHLTLIAHKTSKALGTDETVEAGKLWIEAGALFLQWSPGDQSGALESLRYASMTLSDATGKDVKMYSFLEPQAINLPLDKTSPQRFKFPAGMVTRAKLEIKDAPTGWTPSISDGHTLVLTQAGNKIQVKYDGVASTVSVICNDPDPTHAKRRLDALNTAEAKAQADLEKLQAQDATPPATTEGHWSGALWYPPTVEDRSGLHESIHSRQEQIASADKARPKLEAELVAADANAKEFEQLNGTVVSVTLLNGVCAAQLSLQTSSR